MSTRQGLVAGESMLQRTLHTVIVMAVCLCFSTPSYTQSDSIPTGPADPHTPGTLTHAGITGITGEDALDTALRGQEDDPVRSEINYAGSNNRGIKLTSALSGSSVPREGGGAVDLNASTAFDGATEVGAGRISFNGLAAFDTGLNVTPSTPPAATLQNGSGAVVQDSGPRASISVPGAVTVAGDVSLTEGSSYVVGIDGRGSTHEAGTLTDHSVLNNPNVGGNVVIHGVPANSHYNTIYGTNSVVLDLASVGQGLNAAMYSDLNAASTGHGFNALQPEATAAGSVGVYGFLHSFPDRNAPSAARAFQGIPNGLRSDMSVVNRLANRIVHPDLVAGFGNAQAAPDNQSSTQASSLRLWLEMTGSLTHTDAGPVAAAPESSSFAYYGGIDSYTQLVDRLGISFGYSNTTMSPAYTDRTSIDNYHALMYAHDHYHGYDISLAAGTAWSEYRSAGAAGRSTHITDTRSGDSRDYSFTMDTEVRRKAEFRNATLSGVGGFLAEYRRSYNIDSDNRYSVFPASGNDSQATQLHLGGEIMLNDWFLISDEIQISTHWLYEIGNSKSIATNNYLQNIGLNGVADDSVINGIEFNASYAFAISKDSHLSLSYSAVSDTDKLSHHALASANLTW